MGDFEEIYGNKTDYLIFLHGVIEATITRLTFDALESRINQEGLDADIFYIGEEKEIDFNTAIKNRLKLQWNFTTTTFDEFQRNKWIDDLDLKFLKLEQSPTDAIVKMYDTRHDKQDIDWVHFRKSVNSFIRDIGFELGEARATYSTATDSPALANRYCSIIMNIIIVEYSSYFVMILRGTSD